MISCAASNGEAREDCILWHMAYLGRYCTYLVCVVHKMKKHGVRINFEQIIFASSDLALSSNECCSCVLYILYIPYIPYLIIYLV